LHSSNKIFTLSLKQHQHCSIADVFDVCCAAGFQFSSHLGNFRFGSSGCTFQFMRLLFLFFQSFQTFGFGVSIRLVLGLKLELKLSFRFTFYIQYVSTKLTALSLCVTVTLLMVDE